MNFCVYGIATVKLFVFRSEFEVLFNYIVNDTSGLFIYHASKRLGH